MLNINLSHKAKCIILFLWQLPQNIVGAIWWCVQKRKALGVYRDMTVIRSDRVGGISLGRFIVIKYQGLFPDLIETKMMKHEYGHCLQSQILGPLYLLLIGLPSITFWTYDKLRNDWTDYYKRPWEKWADILGGVERT